MGQKVTLISPIMLQNSEGTRFSYDFNSQCIIIASYIVIFIYFTKIMAYFSFILHFKCQIAIIIIRGDLFL